MITQKKCVPCDSGATALSAARAKLLLGEIPGWELGPEKKSIHRRFKFKDFAGALVFVNAIGAAAEAEQHHPDITFGWGYVECVLQTHALHGLHENDFIMAGKINALADK